MKKLLLGLILSICTMTAWAGDFARSDTNDAGYYIVLTNDQCEGDGTWDKARLMDASVSPEVEKESGCWKLTEFDVELGMGVVTVDWESEQGGTREYSTLAFTLVEQPQAGE